MAIEPTFKSALTYQSDLLALPVTDLDAASIADRAGQATVRAVRNGGRRSGACSAQKVLGRISFWAVELDWLLTNRDLT